MDSDRRHELETNDLKEFLDNFKDFWDKHGNKVLLVLIVGLLAFAGPRYYKNWQDGKADDANAALSGATSPDALLAVAEEHEIVRDVATLRAGDILFGQARSSAVAGETEDADKALKRAATAYTAVAQRGRTTLFQINGYEGLAKVASAQGDRDKAAEHYEKIIELSGDTYTTHAARAEQSIKNQDLLANPIAFAPPVAEPIEQILPLPGITPAPGDGGSDGLTPALPGLEIPGINSQPLIGGPLDNDAISDLLGTPSEEPADEPAE